MTKETPMFYLFLAILCSSSIALIFKFSETNNMNRFLVTTMNYLIAFSTSLAIAFATGVEWSDQVFSLLLGMVAGVFFFLSFFLYQKSVKDSGASLSGAFGKMGILIPMILSIIIWKEFPNFIQWFGIALALLSIILVNLPRKSERKSFHIDLIFLFIFGGMAEFFNKIFQKYATGANDKNIFLFAVFFSAFLISLFFTVLNRRKKKIMKRDFLVGALVGVPNLFSSFFLISSLDYVKTAVAFPVYSAGSITLITAGSWIIFRERLKKREKVAIFITIFALILVNLEFK